MYLGYWGLKKYPFENTPDPHFFYLSAEHSEALSRLIYAIQRNKGGILLTGEIGCGKTLISRVLIQQHVDETIDIALINNPALIPLDFLGDILYQFGISAPPGIGKAEILKRLNDRLIGNYQNNKSTLLIIDEAQTVPPDTLEEIRMLLNFQLNDRYLLNLLFLGQPELRDIIVSNKQLNQRIAIRYHLNPLSRKDMDEYVVFRLRKAGLEKNIFSEDALEAIFSYSEGIPRKINNICDIALLIGSGIKSTGIDKVLVEGVMKDSL
jgi:general secretion pathway protein A